MSLSKKRRTGRIIRIILYILLLLGCVAGTYFVTNYFVSKNVYQSAYNKGFKTAYKKAYKKGYDKGVDELSSKSGGYQSFFSNGCGFTCNTSTQSAPVYVEDRSPVHCTSRSSSLSEYSTTVYTDCY